MTQGSAGDGDRRLGFGAAFQVREFRVLWLAEAQSIVGDQLARVALSALVFQRTGSAALTALTYALTMLPALVSGLLLAGLADRFPRRAVMLTCDLLRAGLLGVMALPGMPIGVLAALLVLVQLAEAPFGAAQGATLPLVLPGQRYEVGQTIRQITHQSGLLAGFAGGGALVALIGPNVALTIDAGTFLLSALLIRLGVGARPASITAARGVRVGIRVQLVDGARLIWTDRRLRTLVLLGWLAGFAVVPEGLAFPFADQAGIDPAAVGLLLAADPAGMIIGAFALNRWARPEHRIRWLGLLAVGTCVPLIGYTVEPGLGLALGLLLLSGLFSAYQVTAGASFVRLVPAARRGQGLGFARAGLIAGQGVGIALGGFVAQLTGSVTETIAIAGAAGTLMAVAAATAWARSDPRRVAAELC